MIVEPVSVTGTEAQLRRAARVSWMDGRCEHELMVEVPAELADTTTDASGFLCVTLPLAMAAGEPLEVAGPASPELTGRLDELQSLYEAWGAGVLRRVAVRSAGAGGAGAPGGPARAGAPAAAPEEGGRPPSRPRTRQRGAFFSRGLDSMYTAARVRNEGQELTSLVFADGLEPRHDGSVRAEEIRRAGEAAGLLGLPLVVVRTNVRALADRSGLDWEDLLGAGLSFVAHALAGSFEAVTIPSSDSYGTLEPCGSSPVLDPMFSTDRLAVRHDSVSASRYEKLSFLAARRPEVLGRLKVCFRENRPDNCGACPKCLHTMAALRILGVLDRASEFPPDLDLEAVRRLRLPNTKARLDWAELVQVLGESGADARLREAIAMSLRASRLQVPAAPGRGASTWVASRSFRERRLNAELALLLDGRPWSPPPEGTEEPAPVLFAGTAGCRHVYAVGGPPTEAREARALGVLSPVATGGVPVWIGADGRLHLRGMTRPPRPAAAAAGRWLAEPLLRAGGPWPLRLAEAAGRLGRLASGAAAPEWAEIPPELEPAGLLGLEGAPGQVALYGAIHPVTGDQLLSPDPKEAAARGYGNARLLGYLGVPPAEGRPAACRGARSPEGPARAAGSGEAHVEGQLPTEDLLVPEPVERPAVQGRKL